jgi:putative ATPase
LRDWDADASCYWIQRMLVGWEDPIYIARRLLRFASEDIWLANNNAILLANQVFDSVKKVWLPECSVFLMQLWIYLAQSPKSNLSYKVDLLTKKDIERFGNLEVPKVIRNAPTKLMKDLWYWKWYKYSHDYEDNDVDQQHFPDKLLWRKYLT